MIMANNSCPTCESKSLVKAWLVELVPVTLGDACTVVIEPTVPVWTCADCNKAFTDHEAEAIRERAAQAVHLAYQVGRGQTGGWLPDQDQGIPTA